MTGDGRWRELTFAGRTAVVTGAARGIGRAVAYRVAGLDARTVIWDVDGAEAKRAVGHVHALPLAQLGGGSGMMGRHVVGHPKWSLGIPNVLGRLEF